MMLKEDGFEESMFGQENVDQPDLSSVVIVFLRSFGTGVKDMDLDR